MGLKVIIFLGPPRGRGRARQALRYQFGNYVSKPSRILGVALFRWLCAERSIPDEVILLGSPESDWDMVHELRDVVSGKIPGRSSDQSLTLFESMGIALEDIAAAQLVYRKAKEQGVGQELPF